MGKLKILLVDDELDFLEVIGARIEGWGYVVFKASGGKEALLLIKKENPDIVVLDYMMPDMSGLLVLEKMRNAGSTAEVIIFTAYPNMKLMENAEELGIAAFIPKLSAYADTVGSLRVALNLAEKKLRHQQ
jgi:two-component system response regulator (stage 0 sporulation protein F)